MKDRRRSGGDPALGRKGSPRRSKAPTNSKNASPNIRKKITGDQEQEVLKSNLAREQDVQGVNDDEKDAERETVKQHEEASPAQAVDERDGKKRLNIYRTKFAGS